MKHIKQILIDIKGEINNTITVGNFNTTLPAMERLSKQKINKEMLEMNHLRKIDLTNIYRTLHGTAAEYTVFSSAQEIFFKMDSMLKLLNKS